MVSAVYEVIGKSCTKKFMLMVSSQKTVDEKESTATKVMVLFPGVLKM